MLLRCSTHFWGSRSVVKRHLHSPKSTEGRVEELASHGQRRCSRGMSTFSFVLEYTHRDSQVVSKTVTFDPTARISVPDTLRLKPGPQVSA